MHDMIGRRPQTDMIYDKEAVDRYVRCVIRHLKERYDGEVNDQKLYMAAMNKTKGGRFPPETSRDFESLLTEAVETIYSDIDPYCAFCSGHTVADTHRETREESCKMLPVRNDMMYVGIRKFGEHTYDTVSGMLKEISKANIKKIILDLRENTGGALTQAILTAAEFVPKRLIAEVRFRSPRFRNIEYYTHRVKTEYILAVLVNKKTASSSEILAGSIQESKSGILIGTRTCGKVTVQKTFPILSYRGFMRAGMRSGIESVDAHELNREYGMEFAQDEMIGIARFTIGKYITPARIDGNGLSPDIYVTNGISGKKNPFIADTPREAPESEWSTDIPLVRAIEYLASYPA